MYPGVVIEWDDQSAIPSIITVKEVRTKPLFMAVFTSDKGPENWTKISGDTFFDVYGKKINFSRHGQPLLQAAMTINAGGTLFCKRLVADDAKIANIGIVAKLTDTTAQKLDPYGKPLYKKSDIDETETTEETEYPITIGAKKITYSIKTTQNAVDIDDAFEELSSGLSEDEYLLYVISDIGRGVSNKRVRMIPNYIISKRNSYVTYTLRVLEDSNEDESMTFSVNPNLVVKNENISLAAMVKSHSKQIQCKADDAQMDKFVAALAESAGITSEEMYGYDPLFGCNNRGVKLNGVVLDTEGVTLDYTFGQKLLSGSNGAFENDPFNHEDEWTQAAVAALDGSYAKCIYDVDQYKVDCFVDANYPAAVKRTIEALADFREDFMYFRDQNLGMTSEELIEDTCMGESKSKFCATYPQSYDIIDPYTKKQITVTIGYSLAQLLVEHCNNGRSLPTAGILHNMVIQDAIYNTVSFIPTICPDDNQKENLNDLRANYASYIDNQFVIETLYTSQEAYTQWSFINNVMACQEIVKVIRTRCPAIRYSFISGEDLEKYKNEVNEILQPYKSNFVTLELEYAYDANYAVNKIFYAVLKVVHKDFVQTEMFKVTAILPDEVQTY